MILKAIGLLHLREYLHSAREWFSGIYRYVETRNNELDLSWGTKTEAPRKFRRVQPAMTESKRNNFDIYIDREYYPCGCAYLINVKSGEAKSSFPCARHKLAIVRGSNPEK